MIRTATGGAKGAPRGAPFPTGAGRGNARPRRA